MQNIRDFLSRFVGYVPRGAMVKERVAEALVSVVGIAQEDVPPIEYQNGIVYVRGGSALKHALLLKKTELLSRLKKTIEKEPVRDIR